ncbi:mRNA turnover and ribosome assembly protein [Entomophthora muscae]|uniref:mRNA turnover and ribosome assembly protein n=1 Tax=Entomophthora muscae TaxID=34485 RepID=A0ACC2TMN5_9FUNG|nr:mRNA turnover and ribosome assembly protein [Entomophthora muscae]
MARSKRSKIVNLTTCKPLTRKEKEVLITKVLSLIEDFEYVYVISINNARNEHLAKLREEWNHSRFLFGKNRLIAHALCLASEQMGKPKLKDLAQLLRGTSGLLFSNKGFSESKEFFDNFRLPGYARTNNIAPEEVVLPEGPLFRGQEKIPHNMEPELRKLGLQTYLDKGEVKLRCDQTICRAGERLSVSQAHLLKHFLLHAGLFPGYYNRLSSRPNLG